MRRIVLFFTLILFLSVPLNASADSLEHGMALYKKHHYEEAANMLHSYLPFIKSGKEGATFLSMGMVYLKNAEVYRELYDTSVSIHLDYFRKLSTAQGESKSRFVRLHMGEALLEAGRPREASTCFKAFMTDNADNMITPEQRSLAKVGLGLSYYLQGEKQKAHKLWSNLKETDPEILSELAVAYSKAGLMDRNPTAMCEKALTLSEGSGRALSMRMVKNIIGVYAREGWVEKGLDLLKHTDTKRFIDEEASVKNKVIRFYDPGLLNNLSMLYGKASLAYLEKAALDAGVKDAALCYLGEAYTLCGDIDRSMEITRPCLLSEKIPEQYKIKVRLRQAANHYQKGQKKEAIGILNRLSQEQTDPSLLAEILLTCSKLKFEFPGIVQRTSALVVTGEGKGFATLSFALGKYYLWKNDYEKAVDYMEAGRDKSHKNRIEYNDPLMLINLAEAYYYTKQFSEALEIYFEMGLHFPAVRQIQVAMQGVYAMEQKSAGDVKIF